MQHKSQKESQMVSLKACPSMSHIDPITLQTLDVAPTWYSTPGPRLLFDEQEGKEICYTSICSVMSSASRASQIKCIELVCRRRFFFLQLLFVFLPATILLHSISEYGCENACSHSSGTGRAERLPQLREKYNKGTPYGAIQNCYGFLYRCCADFPYPEISLSRLPLFPHIV